jgi:ABC-type branched-subunit amino acid transport system ATPase component
VTALLEVSGLAVRFGGVDALQGVDLSVAKGSVHGLIGPNGAGKTTLLNCIGRVIEPVEGSIRFEGRDLLGLPAYALAALGIARTFQNLALVDDATVLDNVLTGRRRREGFGIHDFLPTPARHRLEREDRDTALAALARAGLEGHEEANVKSLPYGFRKSVEIARAMCAAPQLLMLDEPTAGLNASEMADLARTVHRMRESLDLTVLLITHHIEFLLEVADRVTVLDLGRVIADGDPRLLQTDARVRAAYIGTDE